MMREMKSSITFLIIPSLRTHTLYVCEENAGALRNKRPHIGTPPHVWGNLSTSAFVIRWSTVHLHVSVENGLLTAGADLATVSKIVGHEEINTTANYDRRPEEAKKKAQQLLTVPYKRRLV